MIRLAHFSDVHVTAQPLGWRLRDWFTKRTTGWFNLRFMGRSHRFQYAREVAKIMTRELAEQHRPDVIVFSGDATALGFEAECREAAAALGVGNPGSAPGFAVPGNHDYYTGPVAASGSFERHFAPWQDGERIVGHRYPFARRVGHVWLVGIHTPGGNIVPWDATGAAGREQLNRLRDLLAQLDPGPRILVTHYPVCRGDRTPEKPHHALTDLADVVKTAEAGGVCLWLHGHRHEPYHINDPLVAPFPVICAGSATEVGRWGWNQYDIDGLCLRATRRTFDPERKCFRESEMFELALPDRVGKNSCIVAPQSK